MSTVRRTIHADPKVVWDALADPETYPEWLVGAQVIRSVDPEFPAPGADFHHTVGASEEVALPDKTTAIEVEPGTSLTLKVRARPLFEGLVRFRLNPVKAGTEVVLDEEPVGPLRFLAPVLRPLIQSRNAKSLERLRDFVEGDASKG